MISENKLLAYAEDILVVCNGEAHLKIILQEVKKTMAKFDLSINKSKCENLLQDKNSKITSLEGIEVKRCVNFLGHHFSADVAENLRIALNKCLKNTCRIS